MEVSSDNNNNRYGPFERVLASAMPIGEVAPNIAMVSLSSIIFIF